MIEIPMSPPSPPVHGTHPPTDTDYPTHKSSLWLIKGHKGSKSPSLVRQNDVIRRTAWFTTVL